MSRTTATLMSCLILTVASALAQAPAPPLAHREDIKTIARSASSGVEAIKAVSEGDRGAPIVVMEERHDSRAAQIQQTIALVRLHADHGLRHIALEGYAKDGPVIQTDWFVHASKQMTVVQRAAVATRFLKEGEIGAAEFMKLTYDDIVLVPIESKAQYDIAAPKTGVISAITIVNGIALKSMTVETAKRLEPKFQALQRLDRHSKQFAVQLTAVIRDIISHDPWAKHTINRLVSPNADYNLEDELALLEDIQHRAQAKSVAISPESQRSFDAHLAFLRAGVERTRTMVASTAPTADRPQVALVALNVGAAHTPVIAASFKREHRPFAVLWPLVLNKSSALGDISTVGFDRKQKEQSLYSSGLTKTITDAIQAASSRHEHKDQPILNQPWFEAKSELYLFVERIAGGGSGPPNVTPPSVEGGYSDDDFRGIYVYVDPRRIKHKRDPHDGDVFIFPAVLNYNDSARRTVIWVKARRGRGHVPAPEREAVEAMLNQAFEDVKAEDVKVTQEAQGGTHQGTDPSKVELALERREARVEDGQGRVKLTDDTIAAFGPTEEQVSKVKLTRNNGTIVQ